MPQLITCDYCTQKINTKFLEEEIMWACPACGAPLPDLVEEYNPEIHGPWTIKTWYDPYLDQFNYDVADGTSGPGYNHTVSASNISSAVQNMSGLPIGYSAPEQPNTGDLFFDTVDNSMNIYTGEQWVEFKAGQDTEWQER